MDEGPECICRGMSDTDSKGQSTGWYLDEREDCPIHGKKSEQDEIKRLVYECQERFLESGNWLDSVKPLIDAYEAQKKERDIQKDRARAYEEFFFDQKEEIKEKDALIKKLRTALEPVSFVNAVLADRTTTVIKPDHQLTKKPDPEIMRE